MAQQITKAQVRSLELVETAADGTIRTRKVYGAPSTTGPLTNLQGIPLTALWRDEDGPAH